MENYLLSLGAGVLVGIVYSLLKVRSPAPPLIALLGLLGMLIGALAIPAAKQWLVRPASPAVSQRVGSAAHLSGVCRDHARLLADRQAVVNEEAP